MSQLNNIDIINKLIDEAKIVSTETLPLDQAVGRVLAQDIQADRDSPACDVSAMDGYAVRLDKLTQEKMPVLGEICIGQSPPPQAQGVMKIFTGGPVPNWVDAIVKREDTIEADGTMQLKIDPSQIKPGQHIRRQGENSKAGRKVLSKGDLIHSPAMATLANFGQASVTVYKTVRAGILTTGNELRSVDESLQPWQIRDSNRYALQSLIQKHTYAKVQCIRQAQDSLEQTQNVLKELAQQCDIIFVTGGVSMGDHDYVPKAIQNINGKIIFHKLAIRPGKPLLGASTNDGKIIIGLPGNPVSALVTAQRFGAQLLRKISGQNLYEKADGKVSVINSDQKQIGLTWYRLVNELDPGNVTLTPMMGSGDVAAVGLSDGFIEIPPNQTANQSPRTYYRW